MCCCFSTEIFLCIFLRKDCSNLLFFFLAFDFVGSAWPFVFFIPATTANDLGFLSITFLSYLYSSERASISLWMLSAKQGNYRYHFYNVFGMMQSLTGVWTRDLTHSKPALYHFGYRGGGPIYFEPQRFISSHFIFFKFILDQSVWIVVSFHTFLDKIVSYKL